MRKDAQASGISAALLVAIIAGVIILYILFLPAGEKERLFEGKTKVPKPKATSANYTILLSEGPEEISPLEKVEDRTIPNVYLVEAINAKELEKINPFSVRNGWFDKNSKLVQFKIDNKDIDNVLLSFTASKRQGNLIIRLNGEEIYSFQPNKLNVVVGLDKNKLQDINTLEFSVSPVGIKFWTTNEYKLEDIKIVGDITDKSRQESKNVIELTKSEYDNLKKATLKFVPYCSGLRNVGVLDVLVNDLNVYSAVPVCNDPVQVPILGVLYSGENKIIFKTSQGSYSIEQVKVELESKDVRSLSYFFELSDEQYKEVSEETRYANLSMEFVDDDEWKRADISINGHFIPRSLNQREPFYNKKLMNSTFVKNTNYIEIRPKTILKIVKLRLVLWE